MTEVQMCEICDSRQATLACLQCEGVLCETCSASSHRVGLFKRHQVSSISDTNKTRFCKVHPAEKLTLYCVTDKQVVCAHCMLVGSHVSHQCRPIRDAFVEEAEAIRHAAEALSYKQEKLEQFGKYLLDLTNEIQSRSEQIQQDVAQKITELATSLDHRKTELFSSVRKEAADKINALQTQATDVKRLTEQFRDCLIRVHNTLDARDPHRFFEDRESLEASMEALKEYQLRLAPGTSPDLRYTLNISRTIKAIMSSLKFQEDMDDSGGVLLLKQIRDLITPDLYTRLHTLALHFIQAKKDLLDQAPLLIGPRHSEFAEPLRQLLGSLSDDVIALTAVSDVVPASPSQPATPATPAVADTRDFFRRVKQRVTPEQFNRFCAEVRRMNSQLQTQQETISQAREIFGLAHDDILQEFSDLIGTPPTTPQSHLQAKSHRGLATHSWGGASSAGGTT
eukprot:TRINITY_DN13922_c0_g1_i1.p1 TRINITY_DN13922_c0_g1~~TRINITY_DN13922_c0_g1_i1.p1  ORF type:complete len:452 (+),score=89.76 TRINITY_DN13922_c0_g1_i1:75-1430(+)